MPLTHTLASTVLAHLGVSVPVPDLHSLDALINAYVRRVPWESASRIAKRHRTAETGDCPRWPEPFWQQAITEGTGGTCFESNYAFFELLTTLGYEGYLTINNMGETIGCHTAIVILLNDEKWLVDVGLPIYAPLPINPHGPTHRTTSLLKYTVQPLSHDRGDDKGENRYEILREPHPSTNAFTLIDRPVDEASYRRATTADYGEGGLFLDRVIVNKVIDDVIWRFNSGETPFRLEHFADQTRTDIPIEAHPADVIGQKFNMHTPTVQQALDSLQARTSTPEKDTSA